MIGTLTQTLIFIKTFKPRVGVVEGPHLSQGSSRMAWMALNQLHRDGDGPDSFFLYVSRRY